MAVDVEIRLSGAGGQGLQLSARILAQALIAEGRTVAQSQTYEPTSRGGVSRADLVISDAAVDYPLVTDLDFLVILDQIAAADSTPLIKAGAVVLVDTVRVATPPEGDFRLHLLPFVETARAIGNERTANIVALGALAALGAICDRPSLEQALAIEIAPKLLALNREALDAGYRLVEAPAETTAAVADAGSG